MNRSLLSCFILAAISGNAAAVDEFINFQGITGAINTPSADLLNDGEFSYLYSTQVERNSRYNAFHSNSFAIGVYDWLEVSGRNVTYTRNLNRSSDLSANVKFNIPLIPEDWAKVSIGVQDLGGAANNFETTYVVAEHDFFDETLSINAGFAKSDSILGRMDGAFGSIRYQPFEWLQLQAEHDAENVHAGIVLATPTHWLNNKAQITASFIAYSDNDTLTDDTQYGIGVSIPMSTGIDQDLKRMGYAEEIDSEKENITFSDSDEDNLFKQLKQVGKQLENQELDDVKVGYNNSGTIFISVDASSFSNNQLDALATILSSLADSTLEDKRRFTIELNENDILLASYQGSISQYRAFLKGNLNPGVRYFRESLIDQTPYIVWVNQSSYKSKRAWWRPEVTMWPDLVTSVGTEFGVFDVSLALATQAKFELWPGAAYVSRYLWQLGETEDFGEGRIFENSKQQTGFADHILSQTFTLPYGAYNMTSAGIYRGDYQFWRNETRWASESGRHTFGLALGQYERDESDIPAVPCNIIFKICTEFRDTIWAEQNPTERDVAVATYRLHIPAYASAISVQAGQFWQQDTGAKVELERYFGDTSIRLTYKRTKGFGDEINEFIGLGFSLPLSGKRSYSTDYFALQGRSKWNYSVNTLIGKNHNQLTPGTADNANIQNYDLSTLYFNNDRTGQAYLDANTDRLKQVYHDIKAKQEN